MEKFVNNAAIDAAVAVADAAVKMHELFQWECSKITHLAEYKVLALEVLKDFIDAVDSYKKQKQKGF